MITGKSPIIDSGFNRAMQSCIEGLKENPDLVIHYDLESGWPTLITKEQQQSIIDLWESCRPKLMDKNIGVVTIFGTGGMPIDEFDKWNKIFKEDK